MGTERRKLRQRKPKKEKIVLVLRYVDCLLRI